MFNVIDMRDGSIVHANIPSWDAHRISLRVYHYMVVHV